jgi:nucleotide-binding universal stress UspA family protein
MKSYQRVLAVIDLGGRAEAIAHRALAVARGFDATLGLAHVLDYGAGCDDDHAPFLTRQEAEARFAAAAQQRLTAIAERIGARSADTRVLTGRPEPAVAKLIREWGADLVVVGAHATYGLARRGRRWTASVPSPHDVLVVQIEQKRALRRLLHALRSPALACD